MKRKHTQLLVPPMCARHYYHGEAAPNGEAAVAVNLRQRDASLEVTGIPRHMYDIDPGHRLLLVDHGHCFTLSDGVIYCDSVSLMRIDGDVIAMHRVGEGLVVVTTSGLRHLCYVDGTVVEMSPADAVPAITLYAADEVTSQQSLDAYTFASPYSQWTAPLGTADVAAIASRYRAAWNAAMSAIADSGAYSAPLMVRYGVRLWDDNYLYLSQPVTVGLNTLDNTTKVSARVVTDAGKYTSIESSSFMVAGYRLGIKVTAGVGQHWRNMIKAVDIFATAMPSIALTSALDYRCSSTQGGARVASLQFGWQAYTREQVMAEMSSSGWNLVASTTSLEALEQGRFDAPNVVHVPSTVSCVINAPLQGGTRLSPTDADAIVAGASSLAPVASMVRNGRLYLASAAGKLACTAHANAMYTTQVAQVTGAQIMAIAPVSRPLYSGGFGRYAVYMFTSEGIYAVAQSALGVLGEARLVDRTVIAAGCVPVDGDRDIYFADRHRNLCRLTGSAVTRLIPSIGDVDSMAWDDAHCELHVLTADGLVMAVASDGHYSHRTVPAVMLYDSVSHALAVTSAGQVLDLMHEQDAEQDIEYLSHPVVVNSHSMATPCRIAWNVTSDCAAISLSLLGERGASCHGFLIDRLRVAGAVRAPLSVPIVASPCSSVRLQVKGSAVTGTVLSASVITCCNQ